MEGRGADEDEKARPWRIQYEDAYYHVFSRENEGRGISYDDQDRKIFLETPGEASDRFGIHGPAICFRADSRSMLVENDAYVVALSCYIHRNPLRAGMVERVIDYRWSSYEHVKSVAA